MTATPIEAPKAICVKESMRPASQKNKAKVQRKPTTQLTYDRFIRFLCSLHFFHSSVEIIKCLLN
jgi:hypothetical protein